MDPTLSGSAGGMSTTAFDVEPLFAAMNQIRRGEAGLCCGALSDRRAGSDGVLRALARVAGADDVAVVAEPIELQRCRRCSS